MPYVQIVRAFFQVCDCTVQKGCFELFLLLLNCFFYYLFAECEMLNYFVPDFQDV